MRQHEVHKLISAEVSMSSAHGLLVNVMAAQDHSLHLQLAEERLELIVGCLGLQEADR